MSELMERFSLNSISRPRPIQFVLNVPMYVPDDSAADDDSVADEISSNEEEDDGFEETFTTIENLDDPLAYPFRSFRVGDTKHKCLVGKISDEPQFLNQNGNLQNTAKKSLPQEFLDLLQEQGFANGCTDDLGCTDDHGCTDDLGVIIGLNRHKSLSNRINNCLDKQLQATETSKLKYKKFAFYWDIPWTDREGNSVEYRIVRRFYKQLKTLEPEKAEMFIKHNEDKMRPSPPYQHIRETVKNHPFNNDVIQKLKEQSPNSIIYVSFVDGDTKDFNGMYSGYVELIRESKEPPKVMSTGYEFPQEDGHPLYVGSKLERLIRVVTAKAFGPGVYYPEPNFCVLLQGQDLSNYSFVDRKQADGRLESPILLRALLGTSLPVFSEKNPVVTSSDRAQKSSSGLIFSQQFSKGGAPNADDRRRLSQIIQSTLNPKQWAEALYFNRAFKLSGFVGVKGTFVSLMTNLRKDPDDQKTVEKLKEIVTPCDVVPKLHTAAKEVSKIIKRFFNIFEENNIWDEVYCSRIHEFYELPVSSMLTIIDMFDKKNELCYNVMKIFFSLSDLCHLNEPPVFPMLTAIEGMINETNVEECNRAINNNYSLLHLCQMTKKDYNAIQFIFSEQAEYIINNGVNCFEEVTYEDLEDLYFGVIEHGGSTEDYKDLIYSDLLMDTDIEEYSEISFNDVKEMLLHFIDESKNPNADDLDWGSQSATDETVQYFYDRFHEQDEEEDNVNDDNDDDDDDDAWW